jgi:prepilin-type N-terminal cleavage/methylation domain-containing protein
MLRRRRGFTLIELLIVVVIIGVLATIAIPRFRNTKGKALAAAIKSDLHNLATAEEAYFYEHSVYAPDVSLLAFRNSTGVVVTVDEGSPAGWAAHATHPAAYPLTCALFMGTVGTPPTEAPVEGVIGCALTP